MTSVFAGKMDTPFLATLIGEFRGSLEIENNGPLTDGDPAVAFLLSDFCDFCGMNTGEKSVALGPEMLVFLARLDAGDGEVV